MLVSMRLYFTTKATIGCNEAMVVFVQRLLCAIALLSFCATAAPTNVDELITEVCQHEQCIEHHNSETACAALCAAASCCAVIVQISSSQAINIFTPVFSPQHSANVLSRHGRILLPPPKHGIALIGN